MNLPDNSGIEPSIFRSYDIRGIYPEEINGDVIYRIAQAYCRLFGPKKVVIGRDIRTSSEELGEYARRGFTDHGVDVVDIGVVSTDMMYFAVASRGLDGGIMITASHNPKEYNGAKIVRENGRPVSSDSGIQEIKDIARSGYRFRAEQPGKTEASDILGEYTDKILSFVDVKGIKPFHVVANTNFGTAGAVVRHLMKYLPVEMTIINEEPNGEFPKGRPDPLIPSNREETVRLIKRSGADFGVMWDSDADRVLFVDDKGRFLSGYFTTAILAGHFLKKYPGSKVIIDIKLNWAIIDAVREAGGIALQNKTGHSFFKERMALEDAVFGGEISGHHFFKDMYYLDNGMVPFLIIMELLSKSGRKLSEMYQPYFDRYFPSDEINMPVRDISKTILLLEQKYADAKKHYIDGISLEYPDWRANVRLSGSEPLVRVNLEARDPETLRQKTRELLDVISQG